MTAVALVRIIAAYLLPGLMGLVLLAWMEGGRRRLGGLEKAALSFALGSGIAGFYLFYAGILGLRFTFPVVTAVVWPFLVAGICMVARGGAGRLLRFSRNRFHSRGNRWCVVLVAFLAALLLWKFFCAGFITLGTPTYFDDSVSCWNHKAKVYYFSRGIPLDPAHPDFLGGARPQYPNGMPLFKCWVSLWAGGWHEWAVNLNTLLFFGAMGILLYANLRRRAAAGTAFVFTYILLSVPLLTFHASFAYFDMVVGFYLLCGIVYLCRWTEERDPFFLVLSALLFAAGLSVKAEMTALFAGVALPVLLASLAASRRGARAAAGWFFLYVTVAVLPNLPWILVRLHHGLPAGLGPRFLRLEFHPEAFVMIASSFFDSGNYNILWVVFFAALLFYPRGTPRGGRCFVTAALLSLAVMAGAFVFTPFFEYLKFGTTFNRSMLAVVPLAVYTTALAGDTFLKMFIRK